MEETLISHDWGIACRDYCYMWYWRFGIGGFVRLLVNFVAHAAWSFTNRRNLPKIEETSIEISEPPENCIAEEEECKPWAKGFETSVPCYLCSSTSVCNWSSPPQLRIAKIKPQEEDSVRMKFFPGLVHLHWLTTQKTPAFAWCLCWWLDGSKNFLSWRAGNSTKK